MNTLVTKSFQAWPLLQCVYCICQKERYTSFHIIFECELLQDNLRKELYSKLDVNLVQCRSEGRCDVMVSLSERERKIGCPGPLPFDLLVRSSLPCPLLWSPSTSSQPFILPWHLPWPFSALNMKYHFVSRSFQILSQVVFWPEIVLEYLIS